MPRSFRRVAVVAVVMAALAPHPALADSGDGELDVFVGVHRASSRSDLGQPLTDSQVAESGWLVGGRLGYFIFDELSLELEAALIGAHAAGDENDTATIVAYRAQLVLAYAGPPLFGSDSLSLVAGFGGMTVSASGHAFHTPEEGYPDGTGGIDRGTLYAPYLGAAIKLPLGRRWGLRLDGRTFLVRASEQAGGASLTLEGEADLGLYLLFGGGSRAASPHAREVAPAMPSAVPTPPLDRDGDGLIDARDPCPDQAEDRDGFQDDDGCPEADNDQDGVPDAVDRCPVAAEDRDGYMDDDGCPEADNDKDGLLDPADKCPNEAEDKDSFEDDDGCPDDDNDRDGVPDADDHCAEAQETKNGYLDHDGCPDELPRAVKKYSGVIPGIQFDTGKASLRKSSFRVLDAAVKVLKEYPDVRVRIAGHTDDVGDAAANRALSQARAETVRAYLIDKGIAADRLEALGFGQEQPLAAGRSAKARARNRRVEFRLVVE